LAAYADLASQFDLAKNAPLTPEDITSGSGRQLWWKCTKGPDHEWATSARRRTQNPGCPFCRNLRVSITNCLATKRPDLAVQFDLARNSPLTPRDVTSGTSALLWWKCPKGPDHEWEAKASRRSQKPGCPFCRGLRISITNCLATMNPSVVEHFDLVKNAPLTPFTVVYASRISLWWKCRKSADHVWQATAGHMSQKTRCPFCFGPKLSTTNCLAAVNSDLADQFDLVKNAPLTPSNIRAWSRKSCWWNCPNDRTHADWKSTASNRMAGNGCPSCAPKRFDLNKNSWLYLMHNEQLKIFQIGISNVPDQRTKTHVKDGFDVVDVRGPMGGYLALEWEDSFKNYIASVRDSSRKIPAKGKISQGLHVIRGSKEAWYEDELMVTSLWELMRLVNGAGGNAPS
jgi:hypothetical protein